MCSLEQRLYDVYFQREFIEYTGTYEIEGTVYGRICDEFKEIFHRYGLNVSAGYNTGSITTYWMS